MLFSALNLLTLIILYYTAKRDVLPPSLRSTVYFHAAFRAPCVASRNTYSPADRSGGLPCKCGSTKRSYISVTLPQTSSDVLTGNTSITQPTLPARISRKSPFALLSPSLSLALYIWLSPVSNSFHHRLVLSLHTSLSSPPRLYLSLTLL